MFVRPFLSAHSNARSTNFGLRKSSLMARSLYSLMNLDKSNGSGNSSSHSSRYKNTSNDTECSQMKIHVRLADCAQLSCFDTNAFDLI